MRKTSTVIIQELNRDHGKEFLLTEMSAFDGEKLAEDVWRALKSSNITSIPQDVISLGVYGLGTLGMAILSATSSEAADVLSSRLLSCVQIVIRNGAEAITRPVTELDFEEISTIRTLKDRCFSLHFDFLNLATD